MNNRKKEFDLVKLIEAAGMGDLLESFSAAAFVEMTEKDISKISIPTSERVQEELRKFGCWSHDTAAGDLRRNIARYLMHYPEYYLIGFNILLWDLDHRTTHLWDVPEKAYSTLMKMVLLCLEELESREIKSE